MLKISNLNTWYGQAQVLKDVNISVAQGDVAVMLGPNGHGKSTLLKAICGLVEKTQGEIIYHGHPINGLATEKLVEDIHKFTADLISLENYLKGLL